MSNNSHDKSPNLDDKIKEIIEGFAGEDGLIRELIVLNIQEHVKKNNYSFISAAKLFASSNPIVPEVNAAVGKLAKFCRESKINGTSHLDQLRNSLETEVKSWCADIIPVRGKRVAEDTICEDTKKPKMEGDKQLDTDADALRQYAKYLASNSRFSEFFNELKKCKVYKEEKLRTAATLLTNLGYEEGKHIGIMSEEKVAELIFKKSLEQINAEEKPHDKKDELDEENKTIKDVSEDNELDEEDSEDEPDEENKTIKDVSEDDELDEEDSEDDVPEQTTTIKTIHDLARDVKKLICQKKPKQARILLEESLGAGSKPRKGKSKEFTINFFCQSFHISNYSTASKKEAIELIIAQFTTRYVK